MSATAASFSPSGSVNRPVISGQAAAKTGFNDLFGQMQPSGGDMHLPNLGLGSDDDKDGATTDCSPTGTTEAPPANSQTEQHDQTASPLIAAADAAEAVDQPESFYDTVTPWTIPSEVPSVINLGAPVGKLAEATISVSCF